MRSCILASSGIRDVAKYPTMYMVPMPKQSTWSQIIDGVKVANPALEAGFATGVCV